MKRIQTKPTAILTSDWHLREDTPTCRTDDFQEAQWKKVRFITHLQSEYGCNVYHAGDLFNHWKPSPYLLSKAIEWLPNHFYTIYGNHDLPQHNLNLSDKCGVYTLWMADELTVLKGQHWGTEPKEGQNAIGINERKIFIWHVMNYQGRKPWPGCTDPSSMKLMRKYPQYDLILTGHNHKPFVETYEGRLLVNPGSITRQTAAENHKPRVYLWYSDENRVEPVYLPSQPDVISREHIEVKEERDNRIDAFISQLDGDWQAETSFEDNMEAFFQANKIRKTVQDIIRKAIEL